MITQNLGFIRIVIYKNEVEKHLNKKIKAVWTDRRGEYVSSFIKFYVEYDIIYETTTPYTSQ